MQSVIKNLLLKSHEMSNPLLWIATYIYFYFQIRHLAVTTKTQFIFIFRSKPNFKKFIKWYGGLSKFVQGTENVVRLQDSTNYAGEISKEYKKLKNTAKISLERDDQDFTVTYKSTNCDKELLPSRNLSVIFSNCVSYSLNSCTFR